MYISGLKDRNRALNGDIVVVAIYPRTEWKVRVPCPKSYCSLCHVNLYVLLLLLLLLLLRRPVVHVNSELGDLTAFMMLFGHVTLLQVDAETRSCLRCRHSDVLWSLVIILTD